MTVSYNARKGRNMTLYGKVELPSGRYDWCPTPLMEQVVLVTTINGKEQPHIATKSRISVISYGPPTILVFACRAEYLTASNIQTTNQFVVNVPGDDLVATSWIIGSEPSSQGPELLQENGLTPIPSLKVSVPRIAECRAHLECEVEETVKLGLDLAVFGKVVSVSMDERLTKMDETLSYQKLAPFFFLDSKRTASLGSSRRVDEPLPGPRHNLTVLATRDLEAAKSFYSRAFDWPIRIEEQDYVEFALPGGRSLGLRLLEAMEHQTGLLPDRLSDGALSGTQLHFFCEDLPRVIVRLVSAGARELSELKTRDTDEEAAFFADPDGNTLIIARRLSTDNTSA